MNKIDEAKVVLKELTLKKPVTIELYDKQRNINLIYEGVLIGLVDENAFQFWYVQYNSLQEGYSKIENLATISDGCFFYYRDEMESVYYADEELHKKTTAFERVLFEERQLSRKLTNPWK